MAQSPYQGLPERSYWKTGIAQCEGLVAPDIFRPKFPILPSERVATAGSCFAQHVGRNLKARGFQVMDMEPAPPGLEPAQAAAFGYGIYSARYGNIYSVRQLLQLLQEAFSQLRPANAVWERDGRFFDALRPSVEPDGLPSEEKVREHRRHHLRQVRRVFRKADILVFTLGLTEIWEDVESGTAYPTAPGTIAGSHDPARVRFRNLSYPEIMQDFQLLLALLREHNPGLRIVLTVSPVPLTATASGDHVQVATSYSKSVLRAVAGDLANANAHIDYFPSYEIVTGPLGRYSFFEPNLRSVTDEGVRHVMGAFFAAHGVQVPGGAEGAASRAQRKAAARAQARQAGGAEDVVCEEALLEAFAK